MFLKPRRNLVYPLFLVLLPILFTFIVFIGYSQAKQQYLAAGVRNLQKQMNTLTYLLDHYHTMVENRTLTLAEAQNRIKDILSGPKRADGTRDLSKVDVTLGPGDYLLVFDSTGTMIMHPQLEGENLLHYRNAEDRLIIQEMMANPPGVIHYQWQNPTDPVPRPKIAVITYFENWDWYIGISSYESNFYNLFENLKYSLIFLVSGSYVITAILVYFARRKERALRNTAMRSEQLAHTNQSILMTLAVALEERDAYTSGHSQRVAYYMKVMAKQLGFPDDVIEAIHTGGLLHDIGKMGIEDSILLKQSRLTDKEYAIIQTHPIRGEALLRRLYAQADDQEPGKIATILTITRSHHERFDGKGYPDRLRGEAIPLVARIASVADSFDAMTSNRAYRKGMPFEEACDEIVRHSGTQFCPVVVYAFFQSITEEVFLHAHHLTGVDELLIEHLDENETTEIKPMIVHG